MEVAAWGLGSGFCQKISDTDYVVVQPGSSRLAAHSLCISAMREILEHFLGESLPCDVVVHEVTRITSAGVFGERVDVFTEQSAHLFEGNLRADRHPAAG